MSVESSLYHHERFGEFFKNYLKICTYLMNNVYKLYTRESYLLYMPIQVRELVWQTLMCLLTISQDADQYLIVLFNTVDDVLIPCDELVDLMTTMQVGERVGCDLVFWAGPMA